MSEFVQRERRNGDTRHGTVAGAVRHSNAGELPCDACRAAKAEYDRRWRAAPERTRRSRLHAAAQRKAFQVLKKANESEYRRLYVQFRDELIDQEDKA